MDRVEASPGLKTRILAAYDRGEPSVALPLWPRLASRFAPVAAAAIVVLAVGAFALHSGALSGGKPGRSGGAGGHPLAAWKVIDDPTLGLGTGRDRTTADVALAGVFEEGP